MAFTRVTKRFAVGILCHEIVKVVGNLCHALAHPH